MAKSNEVKAVFTAETADMNKKLEDVKQKMGTLSSEMKLASASFKATGNATEFYEQKSKILSNQLEQAQQKTRALSDKLEVAKRCYGENSSEAQRLQAQVNGAKAAEMRIEAQIQQCNTQLERQQAAARQDESALGQLTAEISQQEGRVSALANEYKSAVIQFGRNSTEAKQLKSQLQSANTELQQSKAKMETAENAAKQFSSSLDSAADGAGDLGGSLADVAGGFVITDYVQDAVSALGDFVGETEEFRSGMNQLTSTFEHSGRSAESARDTYQRFYGLIGEDDTAIEASQDMNNLADAGADIDQWYDIAAGSVAAFGDALPVENLIESANETIRTGQVTGGLADALNWTSINCDLLNQQIGDVCPNAMSAFSSAIADGASQEDAMNAALQASSSEQERQAFLAATLSQQYSELGHSFEDMNSDVIDSRNAQAELQQAQADLAAELAPLQTTLTNLAAGGFGFLAQNIGIIAPVAAALAVGIGGLAVVLYGSAAAAQVMAAGQAVLNAVMAANPVGLVVVAIAALVAAIVVAYNTSETFRNIVDAAFGAISSAIGSAMSTAGSLVTSAVSAMQGAFARAQSFLATVQGVFNGIVNAIRNPMQTAQSVVNGAINAIKGFFNFRISWPHIPMPHFTISPSGWQVGDLLHGSIPSLGVSFYAQGGIMTSPTLFGFNGNNAMVGGEAGDEAILPVTLLRDWITEAITIRESQTGGMLSAILSEIGAFRREVPSMISDNAPRSLDIGNERGVVRLIGKLNRKWA